MIRAGSGADQGWRIYAGRIFLAVNRLKSAIAQAEAVRLLETEFSYGFQLPFT